MELPITQLEPAQLRPLKRVEYEALVCRGFFADERIELLGGLLVAREPQSARHADAIDRLSSLFSEKLERRARVRVRVEKPLAVSPDSEPEPDLALAPPGDYRTAHPSAAWLVVEVTDTSMVRDERVKSTVYASGAVDEYWVVDLRNHAIRVFRERDPSGSGWQRVETVSSGRLAPVAFPEAWIELAELFGETGETR